MEDPVLRNHNSRQMLKIFRFIVTSYGASFMTDDLRVTSKKVSKNRFRIPTNRVKLGQTGSNWVKLGSKKNCLFYLIISLAQFRKIFHTFCFDKLKITPQLTLNIHKHMSAESCLERHKKARPSCTL